MQTLKDMLFEDPLTLYIGLGMVVVVLLAIWHRELTPRRLIIMGAVVLLGGGVFFIERYVVTDREQITAALHDLAASVNVEPPTPDTLENYLDDDVKLDLGKGLGGMGQIKEQILEQWRGHINKRRITQAAITNLEVTVEGDRATTNFTSILTYNTGSETSEKSTAVKTSLAWEIEWIRREDHWRIIYVARPS